jgi:hypothetical protein
MACRGDGVGGVVGSGLVHLGDEAAVSRAVDGSAATGARARPTTVDKELRHSALPVS